MLNDVYNLLNQIGYSHPIHPTEVHMPIGLIVGALIFRIAAALFRRPALAQTAHYCTILALLFLFPTILFGIMDWQHFDAGAWLHPIKIKLVLAVILLVLVFASVILVHKQKRAGTGIVLTNYAASFVIVVVLGYFGGNLVYGGTQSKTPESYVAGMNTFNANCAGCHPNGGNVINPALPILNSVYTQSPAAFLVFIRNPRKTNGSQGPMHAFAPTKISDQQAGELYNYVLHVLEHR